MIYLNYEKAQTVFDSGDRLAVRIASYLHRFMISEGTQETTDPHPIRPFDMCYFYYSVIRAIGPFLGRVVHSGLEATYVVSIINKPCLEQEAWSAFPFVKLGIATTYLSQVQDDSRVSGIDFDLGFACLVACKSFDLQAICALQNDPLEVQEGTGNDFDQWLAGFNS
jgi:hypothetical protein